MTETDTTRRPLPMPESFIPYLDKFRLYKMFKDMIENLILALPRDHLKHMKTFLIPYIHRSRAIDRVMLLVSPDIQIDIKKLVKLIIKDLGYFVITRRIIMDNYEQHDDYKPGCIDPVLMSLVTKNFTLRESVIADGWLMFDHPCTLREARCLQQDGVLPTVTIVVAPTPPTAPVVDNSNTPPRNFFQQDFHALKFAYKATLKEIFMDPEDTVENLSLKVFNGIHAFSAGLQGAGQGFSVVGAPTTYRVLVMGPPGAGKRVQGNMLAKHFGLVFLDYEALALQAKQWNDEVGEKLRKYGPTIQIKAEIVRRKLMEHECLTKGWVLVHYPMASIEYDQLYNMPTPPNRVIFMNAEWATCKQRIMKKGVDWCTGQAADVGSGPRVKAVSDMTEQEVDNELDNYFSETLAELRAAAGITAVEIDTNNRSIEEIQVKMQAAVIAAPAFDMLNATSLNDDVRVD